MPRPTHPAIDGLHARARRRHARGATLAIALGAASGLVVAQPATQQQVRGPVATYWITADTSSGFGAAMSGGIGGMLGMITGRGGGAQRTLDLRLGSTQAASGAPEAAHFIPPALGMGDALPLVTPEPVRASPAEPAERTLPQGVEQPKGRMLIFWGCGEKVGPGQPVVIDFSKIGPGQAPPNLASRAIRTPRGPAFGISRTYGAWPNERDRKTVPAQASLRGEHQVRGNYSPDIRFSVDRQDFMAPVELDSARTPAGTQQLGWKRIDGATGYFMTAVGAKDGGSGGTDMVLWSSSSVQELGGALADYLPPAEVARLVRERIVLAPDRTDCTMPAEVVQAMPIGMLTFIAYGDELNVVHPPRPADPKVPWDQQWAVKLRLKSTSMVPLGEGLGGLAGGGRRGAGAPSAASPDAGAAREAGDAATNAGPTGQPAPADGQQAETTNPVEQGVREGVRVLRGLFGR